MVKGVYFHIPFCSYKCPYCDFVSFIDPHADHRKYAELLLLELGLRKEFTYRPKTIYFGGGTPSSVEPHIYYYLFDQLSKTLDLDHLEEVSIEANPEDCTLYRLKGLRAAGFNRISIGAQSLRDEGLKALGRLHSVDTVLKALDNAHRAGFENISLDLIYGYQGQTLKDLLSELQKLRSLPINHLSAYLLTPYEDTQMGHLYRKGLIELPSEDLIADMYQAICESLEEMGFVQYEVSNFSQLGYECQHNMLYWTHEPFIGLGVSAWSFVNDVRSGNTRNIRTYSEKLRIGELPTEYTETLQGTEKLYDYLFVALRTRKGIERHLLRNIPGELDEFFEYYDDRVRLNRKGMLVINEVLTRLRKILKDSEY